MAKAICWQVNYCFTQYNKAIFLGRDHQTAFGLSENALVHAPNTRETFVFIDSVCHTNKSTHNWSAQACEFSERFEYREVSLHKFCWSYTIYDAFCQLANVLPLSTHFPPSNHLINSPLKSGVPFAQFATIHHVGQDDKLNAITAQAGLDLSTSVLSTLIFSCIWLNKDAVNACHVVTSVIEVYAQYAIPVIHNTSTNHIPL